MLLLEYPLWCSAGANMGNGRRRAMTFAMMPDGATFNGKANILTKEQLIKLQIGDIFDDERQNPLMFRTPI